MIDMSNEPDGNTGGDAAPGENERLPWWARFVLYLSSLGLAAFMMVLPVWSVQRYGATSGVDLWGPVMATLVGLTTMTISGIFVFMTFRIDRGTKLTAQRTARRIATSTVGKVVREVIGEKIAKALKTIKKQLDEASGEMGEIKEGVTAARARIDDRFAAAAGEMEAMEERIATAKQQLVGRFETLEKEMEGQFSDLKDGIEKSLLKANVDKLIKEAVLVHLSGGDEKNGGTDESK